MTRQIHPRTAVDAKSDFGFGPGAVGIFFGEGASSSSSREIRDSMGLSNVNVDAGFVARMDQRMASVANVNTAQRSVAANDGRSKPPAFSL